MRGGGGADGLNGSLERCASSVGASYAGYRISMVKKLENTKQFAGVSRMERNVRRGFTRWVCFVLKYALLELLEPTAVVRD